MEQQKSSCRVIFLRILRIFLKCNIFGNIQEIQWSIEVYQMWLRWLVAKWTNLWQLLPKTSLLYYRYIFLEKFSQIWVKSILIKWGFRKTIWIFHQIKRDSAKWTNLWQLLPKTLLLHYRYIFFWEIFQNWGKIYFNLSGASAKKYKLYVK